jgi:hypothetical protein
MVNRRSFARARRAGFGWTWECRRLTSRKSTETERLILVVVLERCVQTPSRLVDVGCGLCSDG